MSLLKWALRWCYGIDIRDLDEFVELLSIPVMMGARLRLRYM